MLQGGRENKKQQAIVDHSLSFKEEQMKIIKVATFNVNSIRSRLHIVIPYLKEHPVDVFCMQETKVDNSQFPVMEFEAIGYHVSYFGYKRYNGVATASFVKPEEIRYGFQDGGPDDKDRLLVTRFPFGTVVNVYVPQGRDREHEFFQYKLAWFERLKNYLEGNFSPSDPLLLCGDMNVAPEKIDVYDPEGLLGHVCFTPEVWTAFESLKQWGLTDLFRKHHPNEPGLFTFYDYRLRGGVKRGLGWRIDHILSTHPLEEKCRRCDIDLNLRLMEKPSDHTVLTAEFELNNDI